MSPARRRWKQALSSTETPIQFSGPSNGMSQSVEATMSAVEKQQNLDKSIFGFWVYLMTDCVLFASLFAVYAVLHHNLNGGPSGPQLFSMPYVLTETLLLLTSSFTCGLGLIAARSGYPRRVLAAFSATFVLGASFLAMELSEFHHLAVDGHSWQRSGFLSSFFTLVGTHGLHITIGLLWMLILMIKVAQRGLSPGNLKRLQLLSMFWHFLDLIWIFIFTIVYLFGVIGL